MTIRYQNLKFKKNSDLTPKNIKDLQRKDHDLLPMIIYLEENKLPNLQKEARKLLLQAADYLLINGVLFHNSVKKKYGRASNLDYFQLVVPRLMRNLVLHMCHDSPLGGHSGIKNTIDRVREHYYFSRLSTIVSEYVRTSSVHTKAGTKELCKMLEVSQEFTPSFAHHCLGTCERSHRTLEERMTPYIRKGRPWNDILPAVIFSMNSCTNAATQYSPFEVVYGNRPQFPLSTPHDLDLRDIPKDIHVYL
ncbi:unnamed protein product [Mytilus coruscus]|uniref:Integrase zinc-binding domain-containing protein n=1 Tax=Mytilus coruscus TaxID=42192 RepID=A0A6J8EC39_MYTCO|nr:unnamed protein product [Mytilus coruscus]